MEPSKKPPGPKDRKDGKDSAPRRSDGPGNNNNSSTTPSTGNTKSRGGREFERKSGTGRGREVSKGGAGGNNWGSAETQEADEAAAAASAVEAEERAAKRKAEEAEDAKMVSYDDYLKQKESSNGEGFGARAEKAVTSEFAVPALTKVTADFMVMGSGKALRKKGDAGKKGKQTLEAGFRFKAPDRDDDAGGRGGRGGGRGGDRDGGRGGRGGGGRGGGDRGDRGSREPGVGKSFAEGGRGDRRPQAGAAGRGPGGRGGRGLDVTSSELFPALG